MGEEMKADWGHLEKKHVYDYIGEKDVSESKPATKAKLLALID
jgi:hypothetical protein